MKKINPYPSLGKLEAEVMEIIWKLKGASVRQVLNILRRKKKIAYTTIMTVMARLYDKGILRRKLDEKGAYIYIPIQNKQNFLTSVSKRIINNLLKEFGELAIAQFLDVIEGTNLKKLRTWRQRLKRIK